MGNMGGTKYTTILEKKKKLLEAAKVFIQGWVFTFQQEIKLEYSSICVLKCHRQSLQQDTIDDICK